MRLHYLQHVPFEPPGAIETWGRERGHDVSGTHLHAGEPLPAVEDIDWLVVMGGPMGAYDGADHPWLAGEKRLLADAIGAGARVIGVCLGAQLVAAALGADVYPAETREIGWGTVEATAGAAGTPFERLGDAYPVLHWHGDTFDLPDGATRTARTDACANQAYVYDGGRVVGLQFHQEVTPDVVDGLVDAAGDLGGGSHVQDAASIRGGTDRTGALNRQLRTLLDGLAAAGD